MEGNYLGNAVPLVGYKNSTSCGLGAFCNTWSQRLVHNFARNSRHEVVSGYFETQNFWKSEIKTNFCILSLFKLNNHNDGVNSEVGISHNLVNKETKSYS